MPPTILTLPTINAKMSFFSDSTAASPKIESQLGKDDRN